MQPGQCVEDSEDRLLPKLTNVGSTNTVDSCREYCRSIYFSFFGVQASTWCACGKSAPPESSYKPQADCNVKCPGDSSQTCGGHWRMNVYETKLGKLFVEIGDTYLSINKPICYSIQLEFGLDACT